MIGRLLLAVPVLVAGLAFASVRPADAATNCTTSYSDVTIKGNLTVPPGASCYLYRVIVTGTVTVRSGAGLFIQQGSEIRGGISASGAYEVEVQDSTVRGSVGISQATKVDIEGAVLVGNVAVSGSGFGGIVDIDYNDFLVSLVVSDNDFGGGYLHDNYVKINLVCDDNVGATVYGNQVDGQVVGDCPEAESGGGDS